MKASAIADKLAIVQYVLSMTDPVAIANLRKDIDEQSVDKLAVSQLTPAEEAAAVQGLASIDAGNVVELKDLWPRLEAAKQRGLKIRTGKLGKVSEAV